LRTGFRAQYFYPKEEVTGGSGELHKEKLHNSFSSPIFITVRRKKGKFIGHASEMENAKKYQLDNLKRKEKFFR
jgi:hypothetical protein